MELPSIGLIVIGVLQIAAAATATAAGVTSIIGCRRYFHVNYGAFSGGLLLVGAFATILGGGREWISMRVFALVVVAGFQGLMVVVALFGASSAAMGLHCELNEERYSPLADVLHCTKTDLADVRDDGDHRREESEERAIHLTYLCCSLLSVLLCVFASALLLWAFRRAGGETHAEERQQLEQRQQRRQKSPVGLFVGRNQMRDIDAERRRKRTEFAKNTLPQGKWRTKKTRQSSEKKRREKRRRSRSTRHEDSVSRRQLAIKKNKARAQGRGRRANNPIRTEDSDRSYK